MASKTVNVIRWSALGGGVFYGFYHNRSLASQRAALEKANAFAAKEKLIAQAKQKWAELHGSTNNANSVVTDVNDPNFDLEKFIDHIATEGV